MGIFLSDKQKVPAPFGQIHRLSGMDPVGVDNNVAFRRLPENMGQFHHIKRPGADHVFQHIARTHRGQLVHIPHQDQPCPHGNRL